MKHGLSIQTTRVEGVFRYGPYIALSAGEYQIKLHRQIRKSGVRTLELEATLDFGKKVLRAKALDARRDDGLIAEMGISTPTAVSAFEVRLWFRRIATLAFTHWKFFFERHVLLAQATSI